MNGRHVATSGQKNEYPALKDRHGEDPARFLESNELMATARIAGIRDPDLLRAYERVATEITAGSYRTTILEAIAERKADLGLEADADELAEPETTTDPAPVAATDGGTVTEADETPPEPEGSDADDLHPDCKGLEAGQVVILERGDATEYIFPATPACEDPYLLRTFDAEGDERTAEPMGMTFDEVLSRFDGGLEPTPIAEIDVQPPTDAATGGAD